MNTKFLLLIACFFFTGLSQVAATEQAFLNKFQNEIRKGIRKGKITRGEAFMLRQKAMQLKRQTKRAKMNDGRIGPRERRILMMKKRGLKRGLHRAMHNGRNRVI